MAIAAGRSLGLELCKILGLNPDNVREVRLEVRRDEAVLVTIEQFLTTEQVDALVHMVENRYRLELIESETTEEWK
jgi:hypothetical protein